MDATLVSAHLAGLQWREMIEPLPAPRSTREEKVGLIVLSEVVLGYPGLAWGQA